jgi:hypothetical protein
LKRPSTLVLTAAFTTGLGLSLLATAFAPAAAQPSIAPDFGSPPPGEVPLLFNDHHVYAKPDRLKRGRVLVAIVRGSTILVPLRSVFEQMGASVAFDDRAKTVDVSKPGADVKVTLGKPEVVINGESRPLDVPPEIYEGMLVVPLRVVSEGMGAYVQWVDSKRTVIVRYLPAAVPTPPAATTAPTELPAATAAPTIAPSPAPTAKPRVRYERFVVGDYIISPSSYNELNAGQNSKPSYHAAAVVEFPLFNLPWMIEGDGRSYRYGHQSGGAVACNAANGNSGCVNGIGERGLAFVPAFDGRDDDVDARFALKVANPRIYIGIGYEFRNTNYEGGAFPTQQHGLGVGVEKLPDLEQAFSLFGSMYYYPSLTTDGAQNLGDGTFGAVEYRYLKYNVGLTLDLGHSPLFLEGGYLGDHGYDKQNAPSDFAHQGPYAGLGIHF